MAVNYYYLISSLPTLKADGDMPITYDAFLEMCRPSVSASVFKELSELTAASEKGPLVKEWAQFYGSLMQELNYQRNLNLERPAVAPVLRDAASVKAVTAAMHAKNPLDAEMLLLNLEFEKLDSLVSMHYFDNYVLFGYAMKLKLLERLHSFDREEGRREFQNLFENIQKKILSI